MNENYKLAHEKIPKLVTSYMLTTLVALLINSVYTLVDSLFVSRGVGDNAMGGISVVYPFVLIQAAISTSLGSGAASIISRKLGEKDIDSASKAAFNARVFFYITAIVITAVGLIFMNPMLKAYGATDEIFQYAKDYYVIILLGNIFSTGFSSIIRAEGKMAYGMLIWVIPVAINILLDWLFIIKFGMGIKGAALATVLCQFASFAMSILFFAKFSILKFTNQRLDKKIIKEILLLGLPALLQSVSLSISLLIMNNVLKFSAGTTAINTFAYINKLIVFASAPILAIMQAISPIVGYNYGAQKYDRVKKAVSFSLILAVGCSVFIMGIAEIIPKYLIMLFTGSNDIIALGTRAIKIIALALPFTPPAMLFAAVFQAQGKKAKAIVLNSVNLVFLSIMILLMTKLFSLDGTWWSYTVSAVLTTIFTFIFVNADKKSERQAEFRNIS